MGIHVRRPSRVSIQMFRRPCIVLFDEATGYAIHEDLAKSEDFAIHRIPDICTMPWGLVTMTDITILACLEVQILLVHCRQVLSALGLASRWECFQASLFPGRPQISRQKDHSDHTEICFRSSERVTAL